MAMPSYVTLSRRFRDELAVNTGVKASLSTRDRNRTHDANLPRLSVSMISITQFIHGA